MGSRHGAGCGGWGIRSGCRGWREPSALRFQHIKSQSLYSWEGACVWDVLRGSGAWELGPWKATAADSGLPSCSRTLRPQEQAWPQPQSSRRPLRDRIAAAEVLSQAS